MNKRLTNIRYVFSILLLLLLWGCLEEPTVSVLKVETAEKVEFVQGGVILKGSMDSENNSKTTVDIAGFCYSNAPSPTIMDNRVNLEEPRYGVFSDTLFNLADSTVYYVRAYAENDFGIVYGNEISFTSLSKPIVSTISVTEEDKLVVSCNLTSLGGGKLIQLGVCYSIKSTTPTIENDSIYLVDKLDKGEYNVKIPVSPNTKYYVTAFASNLAGTNYGEVIEITTKKQGYTISFYANGGSGSMLSKSVIAGSTITLPSNTFTRSGYEFVCWNTKEDGTGKWYSDNQIISPINNLTLYAQWAKLAQTYSISFNANGGSGSMSSKSVAAGSSIVLPSNTFTRSGYEFAGWNTNSNGSGTSYSNGTSITPSGNTTLYAQWKKKSCPPETPYLDLQIDGRQEVYDFPATISIKIEGYDYSENFGAVYYISFGDGNDINSVSLELGEEFNYHSFYTNEQLKERNGLVSYTYNNEMLYSDRLTINVLVVGCNSSYWEQASTSFYILKLVSFDSNGGSGSMSSKSVRLGSSIFLPSNTFTRSEYTFSGWNTKADGSGISYNEGERISISEHLTLYAQWKEIENNQEQVSGSHQGHDYVDLGLPSGMLWATCNVGASKPEEYGDYYAWGETETKTRYVWSTYMWCEGTKTSMTKYCKYDSYGVVDNKVTLEYSDDIARVKWGGKWRMPTYSEFNELKDHCSFYAETINGIKGIKVVSDRNYKSVFFPLAGFYSNNSLYDAGKIFSCWSSSLSSGDSFDAYCSLINGETYFLEMTYLNERYLGLTVRAVMSK